MNRILSYAEVQQFDRDGYVLVPELFSAAEVQTMLRTIEADQKISNAVGVPDASGKKARLAIWHELRNDVWAAASTCPRIVNNVRVLLREEIAFFHGKVMLKEARSGGAWEWHQDYGYWYDQGFVFPHLLSAFVALDPATVENGCLNVLRGSHQLGRLSHAQVGSQTGADPQRMPAIEKLFERVAVQMTPGSVLFFHCNLLHTSAPNLSDHHRRSFIMCYNALGNPQLAAKKTSGQVPCPVGADDAILRFA